MIAQVSIDGQEKSRKKPEIHQNKMRRFWSIEAEIVTMFKRRLRDKRLLAGVANFGSGVQRYINSTTLIYAKIWPNFLPASGQLQKQKSLGE
jgi:hypothetical protein